MSRRSARSCSPTPRGGGRESAHEPGRLSGPRRSRLASLVRRAGPRRSVTINGEVVTFPRQKIAEGDVVAVNGEAVEPRELRYYLVNKPRGVASTRSDPHAEKVIVDLVPNGRILFPVGRLDVDTTGLIVLTNDGVLANRLMHPRYGVPKTYVARVNGKVSRRALGDAAAGRGAGGRPHRAGRGEPQEAERQDGPRRDHHPRGPQAPGAPHVRGGRPAGGGAAPAAIRPHHRQGARAGRPPRARRRRGRGVAPRRRRSRRGGRPRARGPACDAGGRGGAAGRGGGGRRGGRARWCGGRRHALRGAGRSRVSRRRARSVRGGRGGRRGAARRGRGCCP